MRTLRIWLSAWLTGERLLSDQKIWAIIKAKAVTYSQQIRQQAKTNFETTNSSKIEVNPTVKIYNMEKPEILLFDDGIQSIHVRFLLSQLWGGQTNIALNYLKHIRTNSTAISIFCREKNRDSIKEQIW